MPSQILPVSIKHPQHSIGPTSSVSTADTTLLKTEIIDDPATSLLIHSSFEEETSLPSKPLLSRNSSFSAKSATASGSYQHRRRRSASDNSLSSLSKNDDRPRSIGEDVAHAAEETLLSLKLFKLLGAGYRCIKRFLALNCYALLISPGFVQGGYNYFFSTQIRRGIVFGDQPRNRLDLYLPKNSNGPKPVIALVTGGAWILGNKAWGTLLGQQLSERNIIVACIDYRNFPQGTMSDMVKDASQGISFVCNNIAEYGGDPSRIYLMGQSAGAHIAACTLLDQAIKEAREGESTTWSVSQIKYYFGLSGG